MSQPSISLPDLLHRAPPTISQACQRAIRPALGWSLCCFALFASLSVVVTYHFGKEINTVPLLTRSVIVALIAGMIVFSALLLQSLRWLLDRAFKVAAFSATLFGFLMLVVLFWRLTADAVAWSRVMPQLIATSNAERASQEQNAAVFVEQQMAEVHQRMEAEVQAAKTEDEKREIRQFYEQRVKPRKRADLEATASELTRASQQTHRATNTPALVGHFLSSGPSNEPQEAGIYPALLGSVFVSLIAMVAALPLGVGAAVYLEEYPHHSWLGRVIQVNIQNLAGVPSVVYGILGAFVFVELIFKPLEGDLSAPWIFQMVLGTSTADSIMRRIFGQHVAARNVLGGGLTLALLTLPMIIVSAQEAIRAVPASLRHAAIALGATRWQVIWHHVLPQAKPGILTGVILALSRALGEAAPMVLFGALLFVNHNPSLLSRFTVLPMQIFGWVDRPAEAWRYNAALASIVLIVTLLALNATAIFYRYRSQRITQ